MSQVAVRDDGPVRVVTLEHEARRNALTPSMLEQLRKAVDVTAETRTMVFRGAGEKAFCSGYDLSRLDPPGAQGPLPDDLIGEVFGAIEALTIPSIACVNGSAFGAGFELLTACDFRIAVASAQFAMPPAKLGVVYSPEGIARTLRLVGPSRAKLLFLAGRPLSGSDALALGLVDEAHPDAERAFAAAMKLARELSESAPLSISGMKEIFRALHKTPMSAQEERHIRLLRRRAFNSEDVREGRAAFLEKRKPRFIGR